MLHLSLSFSKAAPDGSAVHEAKASRIARDAKR